MNHFLSTKDLNFNYAFKLIQKARQLKAKKNFAKLLNNKLIAMLFYEASTRTKSSFEIAARNLGAQIIDLNPNSSSVQKGETLEDTARSLINLGADLVIIRHPLSGAALQLAKALNNTKVKVINAGDGMNEHPSQALLDLFSLLEITDTLENKQIAIVGDCLHSRVARSNIYLLSKFNTKINLIGPPTLAPKEFEDFGVKVFFALKEGLRNADFIMVLRLQKERQASGLISSLSEYNKHYGINEKVLKEASLSLQKIKILHPGPVNRGVEIDSELVDNEEISLIHQQVSNGLYARMAVLLDLLWE